MGGGEEEKGHRTGKENDIRSIHPSDPRYVNHSLLFLLFLRRSSLYF